MPTLTETDIAGTIEQLQAQLAELTRRLASMENGKQAVAPAPPTVTAPQAPAEPVVEAITEEELLAVSAAIAAYLGVRAHIRQIRLLSTNAWAQQGRVSIQASHRLG
jgi:methylmalonyl-CoA carboxyltransferase large subunit